jgi:hypothetical protein
VGVLDFELSRLQMQDSHIIEVKSIGLQKIREKRRTKWLKEHTENESLPFISLHAFVPTSTLPIDATEYFSPLINGMFSLNHFPLFYHALVLWTLR